jgi:hypothetical protein
MEVKYFVLSELVCPQVFKKYGDTAWQFLDPRLLITLDKIRETLNKPIYINNWDIKGAYDERGLRCIQCDIVKSAIAKNQLYLSAHMEGQAADFDVLGMTANEVRQWIKSNEEILPYPIRLETDINWVHLDVRDAGVKIFEFKG